MIASMAMAGVHTYTSQSVLSDGKHVKISVQETGVHRISYDMLKEWGLNPENVAVLGYGGAMLSEDFTKHHWDDLPSVAFYMHKGNDGVFNSGDYILFYAQGPVSWSANAQGVWSHTQNPYSTHGYYFVTDQAHLQREIQPTKEQYSATSVIDVDWYMSLNVHEKDSFNLIDLTGQSGGGREFYGEFLNAQRRDRTITFPLYGVRKDLAARCVVDMAAYSGEVTPVQITYAGVTETMKMAAISVTDFHTKANTRKTTLNAQPQSEEEQIVELTFKSNQAGATAHLNYIELHVPCTLAMNGSELSITNTEYLGASQSLRFNLENASSSTQIWRVTNGVDVELMPIHYNGNTITWLGSNTTAERYIAVDVNGTNWKTPKKVADVATQNLHALENIDYVIICPDAFVEPSIRLAKKHEQIDGLTWAVVTEQQVFNEFSSGTPDASAYRWLMKMLYDRANGDAVKRPKNLLLMGGGTFDNRKLLSASGVRQLLTYQAINSTSETQAYATDDYFGFLEDNAGVQQGVFTDVKAQMNIGVGRLPVRTLAEANGVVDKICTYMDDKVLGKWKSQVLFMADDGDHGLHVQTADGGAERLRRRNKDFIVTKIYLDAHTQEVSAAGESYPLAKNQFDNLMSNGVLFMDYSGHGGYNNITNELFMKTADILKMSNVNQGFWFLATCSFSHFDGGVVSAGEHAVLNPNGGAIGVLSACRTVYATQNTVFNRNLCDTLFGHTNPFEYHMTIGEATRIAKNKTGYDSNKMPYILLADPALKLNYPTDLQIKTILEADTMHALTTQTIKGYIQTADLDTAYWFNGKMDITIFDKMQQTTTRDNDETIEENKTKITYNDYPNTLFSGQTDVVNGKFEFTFMVPKDIRYNYGNGRIVYYAHDPETREEAVGHYEDFIVGGSSSLILKDTIGPALTIYLNNPAFISGDETYEFPHFYADIHDENGINTVGTGIGHDLLLVVDDDPKKTYVLNNYFSANNNSYQQGQVSYKMAEQTEGAHTLTFRAWDLCNNSSTASLNFQVVKGLDPNIYSVTTYPNPVASNGVMIVDIQYDQPDEVVETTVYLYDISGKLMHSHVQRGVSGITWNMSQVASKPGIYIYQVKIKTATSNYVSKAGKIIVTK
jgi:hypothetical protein